MDEEALEALRTKAGDFAAALFADNVGMPFWYDELKVLFGDMARTYYFRVKPPRGRISAAARSKALSKKKHYIEE